MKISLIIVAAWSTVLLLVSLMIVGTFPPIYEGNFYPFTGPYIIMSGLIVAMAFWGSAHQQSRKAIFWAAVPLHGLLYLPYRYAINRWPGGDDGPGIAWVFLVGGGSCIAALVAVVLIIIELRGKRKRTEQAGSGYPPQGVGSPDP
jgi:hypothetical protein